MGGKEEEEAGDIAVKMPEATLKIFNSVQYMGSFPVAIPDIASRAEYVRSQLETLRFTGQYDVQIRKEEREQKKKKGQGGVKKGEHKPDCRVVGVCYNIILLFIVVTREK